MVLDALVNFLSTLGALVIGSIITTVVLGFMLDRFVLKKIFHNKRVQRLEKNLDKILDKLDQLVDQNGKEGKHS